MKKLKKKPEGFFLGLKLCLIMVNLGKKI